jgi:hypothetical protein
MNFLFRVMFFSNSWFARRSRLGGWQCTKFTPDSAAVLFVYAFPTQLDSPSS